MKNLTFFQCIELLEACVKSGILASDPSDANRILVYRDAGETEPEGWYSETVLSAAQELLDAPAGQQLLIKQLEKKGLAFDCESSQQSSPFVFV